MFTQDQLDTYQFVRGTDTRHRETPFATIHLDTTAGNVHVVQRWRYDFTVATGQPAWTDGEKVNFHYGLLSLIWKHWNSQRPLARSSDPTTQQFLDLVRKTSNVRFTVAGRHPFAARFAQAGVDVDFEVIVNAHNPHWKVTLRKVGPADASRAEVDWDARRIKLYSQDNQPSAARQEGRNPASTSTFITSPHEFGHTLFAGDEYTAGSRHRPDLRSIMNIGSEIRPRHLQFIGRQLNVMLPGCRFTAATAT